MRRTDQLLEIESGLVGPRLPMRTRVQLQNGGQHATRFDRSSRRRSRRRRDGLSLVIPVNADA